MSKNPTNSPFSVRDLHIPTAPFSIDDLKIPTDDGAQRCPEPLVSPPTQSPATSEPEPAEEAPLTPEEIAEGLRVFAKRGVRLSGKRGRGIRAQYFLGPRQAALAKLTTLALYVIAGRPVTQSLALRLALVRLSRDASVGIEDKAIAAAILEDLVVAGSAE